MEYTDGCGEYSDVHTITPCAAHSPQEAAEKRIAELEAREIKLPPTIWYDCDGESQEIAVLEKRLVEQTLNEAGIKIAAGVKALTKGAAQ